MMCSVRGCCLAPAPSMILQVVDTHVTGTMKRALNAAIVNGFYRSVKL